MPRWKLTLAYDGQPFAGWQSQRGGNTIQDILESAAGRVLKSAAPRMHSSGRTDAGVHALAQIVHFDVPEHIRLEPAEWRNALNANLPAAIRVVDAVPASDRFHSRFDACGKHYRYRIVVGEVLPAHMDGRAWLVPGPLDPGLLFDTCRVVEGRHDFAAFAANRGDPDNNPADTVRTIHSVRIVIETDANSGQNIIALDFHGDGFLYKMVRLLTGSMIRVAQRRAPLSWLRRFIENPAAGKTSFAAPADGLYLTSVDYPPGIA